MKTALLLSGNARFCQEFDMQISSLENNDVDWFVVLWDRYYGDGSEADELMSPRWKATNADEARAIIEPNLPPRHKLAHIEVIKTDEFPPLTKQYKHIDCNPFALFQQYWMLKQCDLRRQSAGEYDLVIRSRPDIGIEPSINLNHALEFLKQNPKCIITPMNHRNCGFNDMFAIGLPDTIKLYSEAVDHIDHFNLNLNVQLHSEFMISTILSSQGIQWPPTDLRVSLREQGTGARRNGESKFIPYFGKWA